MFGIKKGYRVLDRIFYKVVVNNFILFLVGKNSVISCCKNICINKYVYFIYWLRFEFNILSYKKIVLVEFG